MENIRLSKLFHISFKKPTDGSRFKTVDLLTVIPGLFNTFDLVVFMPGVFFLDLNNANLASALVGFLTGLARVF